jgi:hypothetical protein
LIESSAICIETGYFAPEETSMHAVQKSLVMTVLLTAAATLAPFAHAAESFPGEAPPPPQTEQMPPPQLGVVWDAGHWDWNGHAYSWRRGSWRDARPGSHWVQDRWEQVDSQWHHIPGHWEH